MYNIRFRPINEFWALWDRCQVPYIFKNITRFAALCSNLMKISTSRYMSYWKNNRILSFLLNANISRYEVGIQFRINNSWIIFNYIWGPIDARQKKRKRAEKFSYFATTLIALHFSLCWALDLIDDPAFLCNESTFVATFLPSRKIRTTETWNTSVLTLWCKVDWMQLRCSISSDQKRKNEKKEKRNKWEREGEREFKVCIL